MVSEYRSTVRILPRCSENYFNIDSVIINYLNIDSVIINYFNIDSVIINQIQDPFAIFANWIDKRRDNNKYTKTSIPYKFNLLYRISRDGNAPEAFHKKCDNKGATIVIIKIKGSEEIIGGYNPFDWDSSNNYKSTTNSFIFSFTDRRNTKTVKVGKVGYSNGTMSIGCHSSHGPLFGGYFYCGNDGTTWHVYNNNNYSNIDSFTKGDIIL
jgi:hypothetical protein